MTRWPIRRWLWAVEIRDSQMGWFPAGVGYFGWPTMDQPHLSMTMALFRTRREADKARARFGSTRTVRVRVTVAKGVKP